MQIVNGEPYANEIKELIKTYTAELGQNLDFQHFDQEIRDFPQKYSGTQGKLLAALTSSRQVVGCVGYTRKSATRVEMKRLFVLPKYRHLQIGRALAESIIDLARNDGYHEMVLDTLMTLQSALKLYKSIGFVEIPAYYYNPLEGVVYLGLEL